MNLRSPIEVTIVALVILVGILIGGMFAIGTRLSNQQTAQTVTTTTTSTSASPRTSQSSRPSAPATAKPTFAATPRAVATVAPTAQPTPIVAPTPQPTLPPTAAPTTAPAAAAAPQPGLWRISEANVHVGTIVWSGSGVGSGGSITFDVHKESVAGHGVSPCEHQTTLHAVLTAGSAPQTVPYREVNCSGATSTGEIRVSAFSGDGRTFSGSFWSSGSKLGDFTASR